MARGRGLIALVAGAFGAALAYFLDPDRGRSRRATGKDQAAAALRRRRRQAGQKARYAGGRATGIGHRIGGTADGPGPEDDKTLEQKVQSEVLGKEEWRQAPVNVMAANGVIELHGEVRTPDQIRSLEADVRKVAGVQDVCNFLHLPGTPAPDKQEAMEASRSGGGVPRY